MGHFVRNGVVPKFSVLTLTLTLTYAYTFRTNDPSDKSSESG